MDFAQEVEKIIYKIAETIEDSDPEGTIDVDLNDGILTLVTDRGTFVINKQSAAKEIWLSSPISGPYHFAFKEAKWSSRTGVELFEVLTTELQIKIER
ncbi:MAG: iron donor protein CyaY [Rickettsiaceae bacterium]|nr:iron donor protein CyaY [Rickettsiaceae bacterium]MDP4832355.1 iron donor protein CyaY [Rickettsiaceae bacterium]MDP5020167.1 iron donor protein CyaY [Rickettsiaceae bacterium]MDP5082937.1 iron donor protein CyaY [Rickettsiaceae bacterium]